MLDSVSIGTLLARRTFEEGEGIVLARVPIAPPAPLESVPGRFWIPELPFWARVLWTYQNVHGAREYQRIKAARGFNWQQPGWERLGRPAAAANEADDGVSEKAGAA